MLRPSSQSTFDAQRESHWECRKPRRKGKSRSSFSRDSRDVQDNPWPNGSTSLRKRCDEGEHEFAAIRGALIKLFLDTIISQEKRSVPDRKQGQVTDRKPNDCFRKQFRKPRDGRTGRFSAQETDAHDAEEDPNSEREESCEEESDSTTAFEREMDELAQWWKNWKTL